MRADLATFVDDASFPMQQLLPQSEVHVIM